MSVHHEHRCLPQAVLGLLLHGPQVSSWLCWLRAVLDISDGSPLIVGLAEQEQLRQRAVIFCRCAQTCRSAYEAAVQLLVEISPWQAADLPTSVRASQRIPEILMAMVREHWLKPHPESGDRCRKLTYQSPMVATLANCVLGPLRVPTLHFYEAGEVSRPGFTYGREPQASEVAGLLAGCPSFLQQCRERSGRDQDNTGPAFVAGEIVELTEFGIGHQAFKLWLTRFFRNLYGEDDPFSSPPGGWHEGGGGIGDAVQHTIPNGQGRGVVLFNDGADYCVATHLSSGQQLDLQGRLFVDDQAWRELTAPGDLAHHMWFYPAGRDSYNVRDTLDGMDSGLAVIENNGFHTDSIRTGVWLRQVATPAHGVSASLREAIDLAASSMPVRAGHELVQNYVTTSGDLLHVLQGYELPDGFQTEGRHDQRHAFNFTTSIVEHLGSLANWAAFVCDLDPAASFELHMHHKLDSQDFGSSVDNWNPANRAFQRKRDIVYVYLLDTKTVSDTILNQHRIVNH
eukprot:COSAG03_NODE_2478_length_2716_cov_1.976309_2_plen_512_part_00